MGDKMDKLQEGIEQTISGMGQGPIPDFTNLAKHWAAYSLETYRDDLLTRGLAISKALVDFDCELKR